jgi:hypothetical protein
MGRHLISVQCQDLSKNLAPVKTMETIDNEVGGLLGQSSSGS